MSVSYVAEAARGVRPNAVYEMRGSVSDTTIAINNQ